jgi:heptaprenylglyceryl phosphate synthase
LRLCKHDTKWCGANHLRLCEHVIQNDVVLIVGGGVNTKHNTKWCGANRWGGVKIIQNNVVLIVGGGVNIIQNDVVLIVWGGVNI